MNALEHRICNLLRFSSLSFRELLNITWGISPLDLESVLKVLLSEGSLKKVGDNYESMDLKGNSLKTFEIPDKKKFSYANKKIVSFLSKLPFPHPHDFDWRFSVNGIEQYVQQIIKYHHQNQSICVISAPTLYTYLRFLNHFEFLHLIERSNDTVETIRREFGDAMGVTQHDLQYPWPARIVGEFDCILMDPPWYQDYFELFLLRATEILAPAGIIHTAIFPPFTKTHALDERAAIISFAQNQGLHIIEIRSGLLEYNSPAFEKKTFSIEGYDAGSNWRKGDLISFYQGSKYGRERIYHVEIGKWEEYRIGKSKVKILIEDKKKYEAPKISTIEKDSSFLSGISRKYWGSKKIGLWTSFNQAFEIKGAFVIGMMLESILGSLNYNDTMKRISDTFEMDLKKVKSECKDCYKSVKDIIRREKEVQKNENDQW